MADWDTVIQRMTPVVHIPMDDGAGITTAAEVVGRIVAPMLYNTPTVDASPVLSHYSSSFFFNAAQSEYMRADLISRLFNHNAPMTFAIWFSTSRTGHGTYENQLFSAHNGTVNRVTVSVNTSGAIVVGVTDSGDVFHTVTTTETGYNDGNPHLVAVRWSSGTGTGTISVDGVQLTGTLVARYRNADKFSFAMEWDASPSDFYTGYLQSFQVYYREVPDSELLQQYRIGVSVAGAPVIAGNTGADGVTVEAYDMVDNTLCANTVSAAGGNYTLQSWLLRTDRTYYVIFYKSGHCAQVHANWTPE